MSQRNETTLVVELVATVSSALRCRSGERRFKGARRTVRAFIEHLMLAEGPAV